MASDRQRTLLLATAALWVVAFVAWTADALVEPMPFALERALRRLPLCLFGGLLCMALARVLDGLRDRDGWRLGAGAVLGVIVCSVFYAFANETVMYLIAPRWGSPQWVHVPDVAMLVLWVFTAWTLLYFALDADAQRRDREVRLAQASAAAVDAQHRLLLRQINPHFLFNALNTIYALVLDDDNAGARRSLLALSAFLRDAIDDHAPTQVPLSRELESVHHYLEIELARFGDRLQLRESIPESLLDRNVPYLILQPLVENCVKHGLAGAVDSVTIRLRAATTSDGWMIEVEDDGHGGDGVATPQFGIGLGNVARRLQLLHGAAAELQAHAGPDGGFIARIRFGDGA
jgi:two-component system LytT family sensor kinase